MVMFMKSKILNVLGDSPRIKLLRLFFVGEGMDYTIMDMSRATGVSRTTCYSQIKEMMKLNFIKKGKKYKGRNTYTLNKSDHILRSIKHVMSSILKYK